METNTNTTAETAVHIAPSIGSPSSTVDTAGAMDYDVTLTIGTTEIECEVTLIPSAQDGRLDMWGDLDMWLSSPGVRALAALSDDARRAVASEIVAACVVGESSEIEIEGSEARALLASDGTELVEGVRVEGGKPGTEDYDTGIVGEVDGDYVWVGWDTGVRTRAHASELRAESK